MTVELAFYAEANHGVNLVIVVDARHTRERKRDVEFLLVCERDGIIVLV